MLQISNPFPFWWQKQQGYEVVISSHLHVQTGNTQTLNNLLETKSWLLQQFAVWVYPIFFFLQTIVGYKPSNYVLVQQHNGASSYYLEAAVSAHSTNSTVPSLVSVGLPLHLSVCRKHRHTDMAAFVINSPLWALKQNIYWVYMRKLGSWSILVVFMWCFLM